MVTFLLRILESSHFIPKYMESVILDSVSLILEIVRSEDEDRYRGDSDLLQISLEYEE